MSFSLSLAGKVAIVTGSGRENGIGAAIALTLAQAGAQVTVNYVSDSSAPRAAEVVDKIEKAVGKGKVIVVQADVSTEAGAQKIVDQTLQQFGVDHIDILVNNASPIIGGKVLELKAEDIVRTLQVIVAGPVLVLRAAYEHMPKYSRVINIGSCTSKMGFNGMPIYSAAKAAMDQLTWTLAREIGIDGKHITINTVAPGPVNTDSAPTGPGAEEVTNFFLSRTRAEERFGTVNDIADAVLLLTSERSRWITGQVISASGGVTGG